MVEADGMTVVGELEESSNDDGLMGSSMISGGSGADGDEAIVVDLVVEIAIFPVDVVEERKPAVPFELLLEAIAMTKSRTRI